MNYSVQNLTDVVDCNALLRWAAQERAELDHKRHNDEYATNRFTLTSQQLHALLLAVVAEIEILETVIAQLPEGPMKDDNINKKTRAEYKRFLLENRKESYGTVALLEKEMDLNRILLEMTEVDAFTQAITERKAVIEASA